MVESDWYVIWLLSQIPSKPKILHSSTKPFFESTISRRNMRLSKGITDYSLPRLAIALALTITNTIAFSRCDKFSQASTLASSAMYSGGLARSVAGGLFSRLFNR